MPLEVKQLKFLISTCGESSLKYGDDVMKHCTMGFLIFWGLGCRSLPSALFDVFQAGK